MPLACDRPCPPLAGTGCSPCSAGAAKECSGASMTVADLRHGPHPSIPSSSCLPPLPAKRWSPFGNWCLVILPFQVDSDAPADRGCAGIHGDRSPPSEGAYPTFEGGKPSPDAACCCQSATVIDAPLHFLRTAPAERGQSQQR